MTRRLLLLRHGKAEHTFGVPDLSRSLTGRGRRQSAYVGTQARAAGYVPDAVVLSPSRRTQETWTHACASWDVSPKVETDPRIYDNTVDDLLDVVREADPATATLLLVGHNPSFELLGEFLDRGKLVDGFQTGLLAVYDLDEPWNEIDRPRARLLTTIRGE
jgi:phosphohistidine phosphatase